MELDFYRIHQIQNPCLKNSLALRGRVLSLWRVVTIIRDSSPAGLRRLLLLRHFRSFLFWIVFAFFFASFWLTLVLHVGFFRVYLLGFPLSCSLHPKSHISTPTAMESLVGRVVSQKIFSGHSLKMNINRLIHPVRGFAFQDLGDNTVVLRFNHKLDCTLALEGSPWLIDRCALVLALLEDGIDPGSVVVNLMQIIVRVHDLPLHIAWLLVLGMM